MSSMAPIAGASTVPHDMVDGLAIAALTGGDVARAGVSAFGDSSDPGGGNYLRFQLPRDVPGAGAANLTEPVAKAKAEAALTHFFGQDATRDILVIPDKDDTQLWQVTAKFPKSTSTGQRAVGMSRWQSAPALSHPAGPGWVRAGKTWHEVAAPPISIPPATTSAEAHTTATVLIFYDIKSPKLADAVSAGISSAEKVRTLLTSISHEAIFLLGGGAVKASNDSGSSLMSEDDQELESHDRLTQLLLLPSPDGGLPGGSGHRHRR